MAVSISNVYIQTFENNVRQLAQQAMSKLRGTVQERATNGNKHNWERLAPGVATQKTGTLIDTPAQELPWSRRVSVATTWHAGEATEQEDPVQMLVDPNSNIAQNLGMSMRRAVDDLMITAATASALNGDGTSTALPATQIKGNGTADISFDLITEIQEQFMNNDIDPDVPKVAVVGPNQVRKLMQLTEQTSADYVNRQALQTLTSSGIVPNWMGFTWIMSTRLLQPATLQRDCLFYTNRAMGLQVNKDVTARIAEDPSKSFAWRIYCHMTMGAVRVEDEHLVVGRVKDPVA